MIHVFQGLGRRAAALICVFLLLAGLFPAAAQAQQADYNPSMPQYLIPEHLSGSSAILIEADSGEVIFEIRESCFSKDVEMALLR